MGLQILFIEDTDRDSNLLHETLAAVNKKLPAWSQVTLKRIASPDDLSMALSEGPDIVLADVFFGNPEKPRLSDIIREVKSWDQKAPHGFPTPVIAYTKGGPDVLKGLLDRRDDLYDIWHKYSANPDYVAWRFLRLAAELPRLRPDATLQRLIATMDSAHCPPWHKHVLELVRKYGEGSTEREQIRECRDPLQSILDQAVGDCASPLMELWDALVASEPLLRAASPKLRGIGRHSINVFWFGYWLINHPLLEERFAALWTKMLKHRSHADALNGPTMDARLGFNTVWLLASLFHDAGKFHEFGKATSERFNRFYGRFHTLQMGGTDWRAGTPERLLECVEDLLHRLSPTAKDPMVTALKSHIQDCSKVEKPEHGTVASAYLISTVLAATKSEDAVNKAYSEEAARATLLHSCLPAVMDELHENESKKHLCLKWASDPVANLLLFCDQVQTWDRHDPDDKKMDYPDRAELAFLEVKQSNDTSTPNLCGCIDYIAPSRVDMYPLLRKEIREQLNKVILDKPKKALRQLVEQHAWPFTVHLDCALSGEKLDIGMDFS